MNINNYQKIKLLGSGTYGRCYLVNNLLNNEQCVLKQIDIAGMNELQKQQSIKQAKILSALDHPYIIKFSQCFLSDEQNTLNIVMAYADGGDLAKKIKQSKGTPFNQNLIFNIFTQICLALKHVHDRKIIHRDLKTHNIFLTKEGSIKLGDFGIARPLDLTLQKIKTVVGTPHYMSPEICQNKEYSLKTDIWSLGVILYELCTHKQPFQANSLAGLALKISKGQYNPLSQSINKDIRRLISDMLLIDPNKRPTIKQILQQPLIKSRISKLLTNKIRVRQFSSQSSLQIKPFLQNESFNFDPMKVQFPNYPMRQRLNHPITQSVSPQSLIFPLQTPQSQNHKQYMKFKQNCSSQKDNQNNRDNIKWNKDNKDNVVLEKKYSKKAQKPQLRRRQISQPNLTPKNLKQEMKNNKEENKKIKGNTSLANLQKKKQGRQSRQYIQKKRFIKNQSELGIHLEQIKEINRQVNGLRDQLSHRDANQEFIIEVHDSQSEEQLQQTLQQTLKSIIVQRIGIQQFRNKHSKINNNKGIIDGVGQCRGLLTLLYGLNQLQIV